MYIFSNSKQLHPPPYLASTYSKLHLSCATCAIYAILFFITFLFISLVSLLLSSSPAHAVEIKRGDIYENVPAQEIVFDDAAVFGTAPDDFTCYKKRNDGTDMFSITKNWTNSLGEPQIAEGFVRYHGTAGLAPTIIKNDDGSPLMTMTWKDIGHDLDNDRVDAVLSLTEFEAVRRYLFDNGESDLLEYTTSFTDQVVFLRVGPDGKFFGTTQHRWFISIVLNLKIVKAGTDIPANGDFVMGIDDLDMPDARVDSTGKYLSGDYTTRYAESLMWIDGFKSPLYIADHAECVIKDGAGGPNTYWLPMPSEDLNENPYRSGGAAVLSSSGTTFRWTACNNAGSILLRMFEPHIIEATKDGSGSITHLGSHTVGWKNNETYRIEADTSTKIKSISVDGVELPITDEWVMEYIFTDVRENHKIHVVFEDVPVLIRWIDTHTGQEVGAYNLLRGQASPIPVLPSHAGRRFTHLSGDDWHCVLNDSTVYINYAQYTYSIPHYSSARYNGFTFSYKKPDLLVGESEGSEDVPTGVEVL